MRSITRAALAASVASFVVTAAVPALAEIPVGVALGLTGQIAAIGEQSRRGVTAAIEAFNEKGGLDGEKIALQVEDDACDPKQGVAVANKLVSSGVVAVVGHMCTGPTIAASSVYSEEGIPMISASATGPDLTERGYDNVFRATGRDDQQGSVAGAMIAERFKDQKAAVVHDKQAYGRGLADEAKKAMVEAGKKPAMEASITPGEQDFSALISRLKQEGIEVVYFGGYYNDLGQIVRQARQQGLNATFVGGDGLSSTEFWAITGEAGKGTLFTFTPDASQNPSAKAAVEAFKADGKGDPDNFAYYYYAAGQVLTQAMEKAGSSDPEAVRKALRGTSFETVVGTMEFDEKGDLKAPQFVFYMWEGGKAQPAGF
ncbi:MAG: branched-chain amino acid ABC transporter substrate-binding protein [Caenispirillum sp.]|nr:branched-chain amino acid ABC transporter substrate-binding protein [Caenispirillum sp.]